MSETGKLASEAISLLIEKIDNLTARVVASDLVIAALMENHPDRANVLDALECSLDTSYAEGSGNTPVAKAAQERVAMLLAIWRRRDQEPEDGA